MFPGKMKKIILNFSCLLLFITSCSKQEKVRSGGRYAGIFCNSITPIKKYSFNWTTSFSSVGFDSVFKNKKSYTGYIDIQDNNGSEYLIVGSKIYDYNDFGLDYLEKRPGYIHLDSIPPLRVLKGTQDPNNLNISEFSPAFDSIGTIEIARHYVCEIHLRSANLRRLTLTATQCYKLILDHSTIDELIIKDSSMIGELHLDNVTINKITIYGSDINLLAWREVKMKESPYLYFLNYPTLINFDKLDLSDLKEPINLINIAENTNSRKADLSVQPEKYDQYLINFSEFYFNSNNPEQLYSHLKQLYETRGMSENLQKADIALQKLRAGDNFAGDIISFLKEQWWNFGYDKSLIFRNSFILFILFFIANLIIGLKTLSANVYEIPSLIQAENNISVWTTPKFKYKGKKALYTFFYTCFIFWGINLSKDKLKFERPLYLSYILLQYLIGVFCLAYIAGYILAR
jgi:hypothetical protein